MREQKTPMVPIAGFTPEMRGVKSSGDGGRISSSSLFAASARERGMCIEYELRAETFQAALPFFQQALPFAWAGPEPDPAEFRVRVGSRGAILRRDGDRLTGQMMTWGWEDGRQIIFNLRSEEKDFSQDNRVLILVTGYCEFTEPMEPRIMGYERHFFTMKGQRWFALAGIAVGNGFSVLTTKAGPDSKQYRRRQACALSPAAGLEWLDRPRPDLLKASEAGTMSVRTLYSARSFAVPSGFRDERQKSGVAAAE